LTRVVVFTGGRNDSDSMYPSLIGGASGDFPETM
jgi:hypothetical protein